MPEKAGRQMIDRNVVVRWERIEEPTSIRGKLHSFWMRMIMAVERLFPVRIWVRYPVKIWVGDAPFSGWLKIITGGSYRYRPRDQWDKKQWRG